MESSDDVINVSTEDSDNLCIVSDVLCEPCSQLRIIMFRVSSQSVMILVTGWLAVLRQAVFSVLLRPAAGSSLSQCCYTHAWVPDILLAFSSAPRQSEEVPTGIMFVCLRFFKF